jgi:hypothetical protein
MEDFWSHGLGCCPMEDFLFHGLGCHPTEEIFFFVPMDLIVVLWKILGFDQVMGVVP